MEILITAQWLVILVAPLIVAFVIALAIYELVDLILSKKK